MCLSNKTLIITLLQIKIRVGGRRLSVNYRFPTHIMFISPSGLGYRYYKCYANFLLQANFVDVIKYFCNVFFYSQQVSPLIVQNPISVRKNNNNQETSVSRYHGGKIKRPPATA